MSDLVLRLGLEQPSVSKHLRVLRDVGLVRVRRHGRQMLYRANAEAIRPLHEWTKTFERLWAHQLTRIKERAEGERPRNRTGIDERGAPNFRWCSVHQHGAYRFHDKPAIKKFQEET